MVRRIAVVLGTRPEIIKMAEVIQLLGDNVFLVHTGQHWDHMMSGHFMTHLGLPEPEVVLSVGGTSSASQIAGTLSALDEVFDAQQPDAVMVQGDTNTVVGGALAASAHKIPLVHVEAGLRSFDRRMPEEHNRVITDHLADLCLVPTEHSRQLLLAEGIPDERIVVTGNTVVGAISRALVAGKSSADEFMDRLGLHRDGFVVATIHRPENTDDPVRLEATLQSLLALSRRCPVVVPLHPRTRKRIAEFGFTEMLERLIEIEPLGYEKFACLCASAALTISDSGGVQEEASVWKRPVLVVRRSTERPEVAGTFAHLCEPGEALTKLAIDLFEQREALALQLSHLPSPYGDLSAAQRCVDATYSMLERIDQSATFS